MQIVQYPHPALRWKSKPVLEITLELQKTIREMFDWMYKHEGIGLAANQVALPYRVFIINTTGDPEEKDEELVFINPEIVRRKGTVEAEEGCLSLPKLYGQVKRSEEVEVEAFDIEGRGFGLTAKELGSRAIQHELDHLDGTLFIDRMSDSGRRELAGQLTDFDAQFRQQQSLGVFPSDELIREELLRLEPK